jgi:hypothetical protein
MRLEPLRDLRRGFVEEPLSGAGETGLSFDFSNGIRGF